MSAVFITGGSRGIGRAIAIYFASKGWDIAFTYATRKESADETVAMVKEAASDAQIRYYQLDLKDENAIEAVCEQAIADFPDLTVAVNNAAVINDNAAALLSNEAWNEVIKVNLTAPFLVSRSFLFHFLSQRKGRFIHLSSISANGSTGQINYATSKAGLRGMSMTLAKEYGVKGITSNIITVGYVPTSLTQEHMNEYLRKYWLQHCPIKRVGTSEEVAAAVYFLTSDEASFITGEDLWISGGFTYAP